MMRPRFKGVCKLIGISLQDAHLVVVLWRSIRYTWPLIRPLTKGKELCGFSPYNKSLFLTVPVAAHKSQLLLNVSKSDEVLLVAALLRSLLII